MVATPSPKQSSASLGADPFSGGTGGLDPFAGSDPFSQTGSGGSGSGGSADPFDPFSGSGSLGLGGNGSQDAQLAEDSWDLSGGWISGMAAGNLKATTPVAFTTAMLAWGYMAFPQAYKTSGQEDTLRDSVRWGADYLLKVRSG